MIKVCEYCGKEFETDRECKRFCSRGCKDSSRRKRIKEGKRLDNIEYKRICPECGVEFVTNNITKEFCSRECVEKHFYKNNIDEIKEYNKNYRETHKEYYNNKVKEYHKNKVYTNVCISCGKEFSSKSRSTKYCIDCHAQKLYVRKCKCCGKQFVGKDNKCDICKNIKVYCLCECKECGKLFLSKTKDKSICGEECNKIINNRKTKAYRDNPDSNYKSS